ncbi:MAG TPA: phosphoglycerate mutase [Rhodanobacteraceae bacterium]|nr:phosphoglycerate mutase [Rhodanobacteraceae bacterium]
MSRLRVLLPPRASIEAAGWIDTWLPRGDALPSVARGREAQLHACFQLPTTTLPVAALLRQQACGDAGADLWLNATPSWVLVEINGARLMNCGGLELSAAETDALTQALRPLFGDHGALLEATHPSRWQLRLAPGATLPDFDTPGATLGDDLLDHLPHGEHSLRWRSLFNEAQMILHQHPVNQARRQRGQSPVNALWFWGAGVLPSWVKSALTRLASDDPLLQALAAAAAVPCTTLTACELAGKHGNDEVLLDLADTPALGPWWSRIETARRHFDSLQLHFADGTGTLLKRWHRWRIWRRRR